MMMEYLFLTFAFGTGMESTGLRDKIQVSQETAELLYAAGKSRWVSSREDKIVAKGKGEVRSTRVSASSLTRTKRSSTSFCCSKPASNLLDCVCGPVVWKR